MKSIKEALGNTKPIPGFRVMEWLRGVRDADYELFVKDREAYYKKDREASDRIAAMRKRQKERAKAKQLQVIAPK